MFEKHGSQIYKYNYLISSLRKRIFDEEFAPCGKLPTERELSSLYNFSRVTVRAALRQLEQEGLIERRQGCGTRLKKREPDQKLRKARKVRILFVSQNNVDSVDDNPFYGQLFLGFHRASQPDVSFDIESLFFKERVNIKEIIEHGPEVDAYLLNYSVRDEDLLYLEEKKIKYLCMGHPEGFRTVPKIDIDNFQGAFLATKHLLELGYCNIALLHHNYAEPLQEASISGYKNACNKYCVEVRNELIHKIVPYSSISAEDCLENMIGQNVKFDSVIVMGDWATFGVMNVLKRHRIKIPQEVGVVSYDTFPWLVNGFKPRPTNMVLPFAKMAEKALLMLGAMNHEVSGVVTQALVIPELCQGQTT